MHTYGQVKFEEIYKECRLRYIRQTCRLKKFICWTPEGDLVLLNPRKVRRGSPYLTGAGKAGDKQNSLECDFEKCASAPRIADLISSSTLSRFQQAMQNSVQKCTFPTSSSFPPTASSRGYARELVLMRKQALMSPASNKTLTTVENIAPVPTPKLNATETTDISKSSEQMQSGTNTETNLSRLPVPLQNREEFSIKEAFCEVMCSNLLEFHFEKDTEIHKMDSPELNQAKEPLLADDLKHLILHRWMKIFIKNGNVNFRSLVNNEPLLLIPLKSIVIWGVRKQQRSELLLVIHHGSNNACVCLQLTSQTPLANFLSELSNAVQPQEANSSNTDFRRFCILKLIHQPFSCIEKPSQPPVRIKKFPCKYLGNVEVPSATGINILNDGIEQLVTSELENGWIPVLLEASQTSIFIKHSRNNALRTLLECKIHLMSFMGIFKKDLRIGAFVERRNGNVFLCHAFFCYPTAGKFCKMLELSCRLNLRAADTEKE